VHAAVVELDALADPVGAAAEDDDLAAIADLRLVLALVGGVEVGGVGDELGGAGVDAPVDGGEVVGEAARADRLLGGAAELGDPAIAEAPALGPGEGVQRGEAAALARGGAEVIFAGEQLGDLADEPGIDAA
jgi:hypothetical protein